jgi:NAD(P)-dependent dehydrogenase (short-subunit alcohol dehydrogenase family)
VLCSSFDDGLGAAGLVADAASAEDAKRTIARAVDTWGGVGALVNNVGAGRS